MSTIDFGDCPLELPRQMILVTVINGIVRTVDFGHCQLIGIVQTIDFGECPLNGIDREIHFGDCL